MSFRALREHRLSREVGTLRKEAGLRVALIYPSPYRVGMSSLGFQTIYRELNALPGVAAERAFLPDDVAAARAAREPLATYESARAVGDFDVIAFSLAYELELAGVVDCLDLAGVPALASERAVHPRRWPLVVVGGPLTFSNPVPAGPLADVIVMGEAEGLLAELMDTVAAGGERHALLAGLARRPGFYVPAVHGEPGDASGLVPIAKADDRRLPAHSQIRTPDTELSDMFLIEAERGCHRECTYCVMRRSTNGGMRKVPPAEVLRRIPGDARRVGLVGAAVTDHPGLPEILRALVESGREVGISSLRADRLDDEIVGLLRRGGYRTLTTASDGASQRLRDQIRRKTREQHLLRAAELARAHGMRTLKLYLMLGLPGETDADIDELVRFSGELAAVAPALALGIAPFVPKRNTPLDGERFEEPGVVAGRLARLRDGLSRQAGRGRGAGGGKVEIRSTSARWAWVEYRLAQGGFGAGRAAIAAARAGGDFAAWRRALAEVPEPPVRAAAVAPARSPVRLSLL